jgi:L-cysteine/cystine lyase
MTDLTTILDKSFLEFLETSLTKLCEGQVSVIFEDAQSQPITEAGKRVFPDREGYNICKTMIDCQENENGHRECLRSDKLGADWAEEKKKGYLYRCHEEKGFPNFLFPIRIWPEEVIGYLYVGQFVFKPLENSERDSFLEDLKKSRYYSRGYERFIAKWTSNDLEDFWEHAIEPKLRARFAPEKFRDLILRQVELFGLTPSRFFDIIGLIEGIADRLSTLGNSYYLLKSLVEIETRLPPFLRTRYDSALAEWRSAVLSVVSSSEEKGVDSIRKTVETITNRSLEILSECKNCEDHYIKELIKPYELGIIRPTEDSQDWILQFYAISVLYEIILYAKMKPYAESRVQDIVRRTDDVVFSYLNTLASCGSQFPSFRGLSKSLFLKLYRERDAKFLVRERFIPCIRNLFGDDTKLQKWLDENGIVDLDIRKYPERIEYFSRTFDVAVQDLSANLDEMQRSNSLIEKSLKKGEKASTDISELADHLRTVNKLKISLSRFFSTHDLGYRSFLDLKAYRVFLNSGGLSPTHLVAVNEQNRWMALRNEEGPIGTKLETELGSRVEKVRRLVAERIGAENNDSVVFTNSTTSSIDLVLRGVMRPGDEILITDLEHDVVFYLSKYFEEHHECKLTVAKIREELLTGKDPVHILMEHITSRTRLVILSHVSYGLGIVLPIKEFSKSIAKCNEKREEKWRIFVLVDGAHAAGNIKVNVKDLGCDFYAFDGHKWLMGPEGIGLLYCKEEYLRPDNKHGVIIPFSNAYMVSAKYLPKNGSGNGYELGTTDVSKILGLGAVFQYLSTLRFPDLLIYRKGLVKKFEELLKDTSLEILNSKSASETGIVCLRIPGRQDIERYKKSVAFLENRNVATRFIKEPQCLRLCFHFYNNQTDVEIAAFHLRSLLEGVNIHIGNHLKVKEKLKELVMTFLDSTKPIGLKSFVGLSIFSIEGSGKTTVIEDLMKDLKKKGIQNFTASKTLLRSKNPDKELLSIFDQAWKKRPAVVFVDEADAWLREEKKDCLGVFNKWADKILSDKKASICVLAAENDPQAIFGSAARRLMSVYFPLPDRETRLKFLQEAARGKNCSSQVLLPQIARLTEKFSWSDLIRLWNATLEEAKDNVISPAHFQKALESTGISDSARSARLLEYGKIVQSLKPKAKLLTGEVEG